MRRYGVALPVDGPGPFFALHDQEADLRVTLTDVDGVSVSQHPRLVITTPDPAPEQPDLDGTAPTPPVARCTDSN